MKKCYVKDIIDYVGSELTDLFILKELSNYSNTKGTKWSECVFSDGTGNVQGVLWSDSMDATYHSYIGKVVYSQGSISLRDGQPIFNATSLKLADLSDYNLDDFIYQLDDEAFECYKNELHAFIDSIENQTIKSILQLVFTEKMLLGMKNLPAGISYHHSYNGGLLAHILEITNLAESMIQVDIRFGKSKLSYIPVNRDVTIGGALLHDIGKVYEYTPFPMAGLTKCSRLTGFITEGNNHLQKAYAKVVKTISQEIMDKDAFMQLQHILLSTHATKKSGYLPSTKEALIVANADRTSTDMDAYGTAFYLHDCSSPNNIDTEVFNQYFGHVIIR